MEIGNSDVLDLLVLIGLLSFPAYAVAWTWRQVSRNAGRRLWVGALAFLGWCAATYFCFFRFMLGCMGGGCAGRASQFLEYAVMYVGISAALIMLMHKYRGHR